jgi:hypothetical protein
MRIASESRIESYSGVVDRTCMIQCDTEESLEAVRKFVKNYDPPPRDRTLCGAAIHVADDAIEVGGYEFPRRTGAARNLANYVTECADWLDRNKGKNRD